MLVMLRGAWLPVVNFLIIHSVVIFYNYFVQNCKCEPQVEKSQDQQQVHIL